MKRRAFLATMAMFSASTFFSDIAEAFDLDLGLPGMTINTADIRTAGARKMKTNFDYTDFTPEQEYYIGRTVAALIVNKYKTLEHERIQKYINVLGKLLSQASDRPETFGGYHFAILDTPEINALSAPGGFIFLTKGLIKSCKTEDSLAAILAHEIGHIQQKHGLQAIKKSRVANAITTLAIPDTSTMSRGSLADLTKMFEKTVSDIMTTLTETGYSKTFEEEADTDAITILRRVGYPQTATLTMLNDLNQQIKSHDAGFAKTHPESESRITFIEGVIGKHSKPKVSIPRKFRFMSMTAGI